MTRFLRALLGDPDAQMALACKNWLVAPEKQNRGRALYWARRASKNGVPEAGALLGAILVDSSAPEVSAQEIYKSFEEAASSGDVGGQYSLGWCHEQGVGVPKNLQKALYWYTMAATNGDSEAESAVGRLCSQMQSPASPDLSTKDKGAKA